MLTSQPLYLQPFRKFFVSLGLIKFRNFYYNIPYFFVTLGCSYLFMISYQCNRIIQFLTKRFYNDKRTLIISNVNECLSAVAELKKSCKNVRVLGMDCEWLSDSKPGKVALLQLASLDGYCLLFRLCKIGFVPNCLSELLGDGSIIKTGVAVTNDARKLFNDYGVRCNGCIDVRYLANHVHLTALGLGKMSELYLGVELDKSWRIRCSNWESDILTERQIRYAAQDALMSVYLFEYFNNKHMAESFSWWQRIFWTEKGFWCKTLEIWMKYADLGFSERSAKWHQQNINYKNKKDSEADNDSENFVSSSLKRSVNDRLNRKSSTPSPRDSFRQFSTRTDIVRKSPLYHNIYIQAPDGMVLCTCDDKKASWYLNKGIAHVVQEEPLIVRLNFEPSGRKGGGEGYYAKVKNNICVVCGSAKSMRRKNIVPHEYRKFFPVLLKEHSSHDVLLLCSSCHFKTQFYDNQLRMTLAEECNAPFGHDEGNIRVELPELRHVKSAAKALFYNSHMIPESRKKELELVLTNYLKNSENVAKFNEKHDLNSSEIIYDKVLLESICKLDTTVENNNYQPHGLKVVKYYTRTGEDGVHRLEKLWRKHFVKTMSPKYLPDLWSVDYVHSKLE